MKRLLAVLSLCCVPFCNSRAGVIGSLNPADFPDPVDWCQLGCQAGALATPQTWASAGGATGVIGNFSTGDPFFNPEEDSGWVGNFPSGMGLIYNGVSFGNIPTQIGVVFDQPEAGAGAYIQTEYFGSFTATVTLWDASFNVLGSPFTVTSGVSDTTEGSALFIGAYDSTADVWAVTFEADGSGPDEPDFAIGTMQLASSVPTPEPASFLIMAPALLGMAGVLRRRESRKSKVLV